MTDTDTKALRLIVTNTGIVSALERQRQIDEDGVEVGVCREALHYAIIVLNAAPALLDELDRLRAENERLQARVVELQSVTDSANRLTDDALAENERLRPLVGRLANLVRGATDAVIEYQGSTKWRDYWLDEARAALEGK